MENSLVTNFNHKRSVSIHLVICLLFPLILLFVSQNFLYTSVFTVITILSYFWLFSHYINFKYGRKFLILHVMSFFIIFFSVFSNTSTSLFALVFFLLFPLSENIAGYFTREKASFYRGFFILYWLTIFYTFLLYFYFPVWFQGTRFSGFSPTPTTFTTYLLLIFVIYFFIEKSKFRLIVSFFPTFFFVFISQTRISILLLIIVLFFRFFHDIVSNNLSKFFIIMVLFSISLYPITASFDEYFDFSSRYDNEIDYSKLTRLALFNNQIEALSNESLIQFLFGNGIKSGNKVGFDYLDYNIDQHNDFFILIYEYGFIFFLVFVFFLYKICNSSLTLAVMSIYLFSFYHNMIYSVYSIFILFLSFCYSRKNSRFH